MYKANTVLAKCFKAGTNSRSIQSITIRISKRRGARWTGSLNPQGLTQSELLNTVCHLPFAIRYSQAVNMEDDSTDGA